MTENFLPETLREQIADCAIDALANIVKSYETHTSGLDGVTEENFYDAHKNARMALSHMELLIKTMRGLGVRDPVIEQAEKACLRKAYDEWTAFCNGNTTNT